MSIFEREALLVGEDGVRKLSEKTVAVFGLGGVGSFVCEALARGGIGHLILVENLIHHQLKPNQKCSKQRKKLRNNKLPLFKIHRKTQILIQLLLTVIK